MQSIAIFPCSFTHGASVIGELSNCLRLKVYTDELLFADVSNQFGIPVEDLEQVLCGRTLELHRHQLKKEKYINLLGCALEALFLHSPGGRLHYGLHTSLLETTRDKVFKVLVFDREEARIQRAMQQEGLNRNAASQYIHRQDAKVAAWTGFLFGKKPYDASLYDVLLPVANRNSLEITAEIASLFNSNKSRQIPFVMDAAGRSAAVFSLYRENGTGCTV